MKDNIRTVEFAKKILGLKLTKFQEATLEMIDDGYRFDNTRVLGQSMIYYILVQKELLNERRAKEME